MRKIETQMNAAIHGNQNWSSGNTAVYFDSESGVSVVRLHGNKIAEIGEDSMTIFDGGFQSVTPNPVSTPCAMNSALLAKASSKKIISGSFASSSDRQDPPRSTTQMSSSTVTCSHDQN